MSTGLENSLVTPSRIERVSVGENGTQGNDHTFLSSISGDGRYVTFSSDASNLVPGDTNGAEDVFVYDRELNTTELVSVDKKGTQGNRDSIFPSISGDGRYVTFESRASNLIPGDTNNNNDIFVYDRELNTTERVSVDSNGTQGNNGGSARPSISEDGRYVTFASQTSNLVPGDTNGNDDVFVYDRELNTTERVSVDSNGTQGNNGGWYDRPSISGDGRYVTFASQASNLVPGDNNDVWDVFVYDRELNTTERVSIDNNGIQGNYGSYGSSISRDGRYVTFSSDANNLVPGDTNDVRDVFVYDRKLNTTERVSIDNNGIQGNYRSYGSSISGDGRYVTFESDASNLVPGNTNNNLSVFVYDRELNTTELVFFDSNGSQVNNTSGDPSISGDGRYATFFSQASNLVPGDTNRCCRYLCR